MASNVFSVFTLLLACFCVFSTSSAQETDHCVCVLFHLCINGTLVTDGGIGLDERGSFPGQTPPSKIACNLEGYVCCPKKQLSEALPPQKQEVSESLPPKKQEVSESLPPKGDEGPIPLTQGQPPPPTYENSPNEQGPTSTSTEAPIEISDTPEVKPQAVSNPKPGHCGIKRVTLEHRVSHISLRESVAKYAEFPWMLAVLVESDPEAPFKFHCGASLIHKQVALTAAHCVDRVSKSSLWVRAGEWNTRSTEEPLPHQDRKVSHVEIHPSYSHSGLKHDIALLFLDYAFDIKDNVDTICLPSPKSIFSGMQCTTTGWGKDPVNPNVTHHAILHKVDLPILTCEECQERLRKSPRVGPYFHLHPSSLCAGGEIDRDACKGDGGGPLVCAVGEEEPKTWLQAGIVSWGIGCGTTYPGVYTDVTVHSTWIYDKIVEFERPFINSLPADVVYRYFPNLRQGIEKCEA